MDSILENGFLREQPILVDKNYRIILDGHHRARCLRFLGMENIPAKEVDYFSAEVNVKARRQGIKVSKEKVLETALKGELFPHKSTKHFFKGGKQE